MFSFAQKYTLAIVCKKCMANIVCYNMFAEIVNVRLCMQNILFAKYLHLWMLMHAKNADAFIYNRKQNVFLYALKNARKRMKTYTVYFHLEKYNVIQSYCCNRKEPLLILYK